VSAARDRLIALNAEYHELTGEDFYLYTSVPGDGQTRCVFTDGVKHGYPAGADHMLEKLTEVKERELRARERQNGLA
jgi:hypothetical protein